MYVVTADQRASRTNADLVPAALDAVADIAHGRLSLPPDRTVGDELQLLTADADACLATVLLLTRGGDWSVGVGVGTVETPLPAQTRAARGTAFVHARSAVTRAKSRPVRFAVIADDVTAAEDAEALVSLLLELRTRRTFPGWEVYDLLAQGHSQQRIAEILGITATAVSLRARAAGLRTEEAAVRALIRVLERLDAEHGRTSVTH